MIIDGQFWIGVGLLALLTLSPGATTALIIGVAAENGRRAAFITSLGIASGILCHATASAVGLAAILAASPQAFAVVKIAGAVYLGYLGIRTLLRAGRRTAVATVPSQRDFYTRGLLTNLLNPQVALFYLTFLPQFIDPHEPVLAKSLLFGLAHGCIAITWFALYAYGITTLATRVRAVQPWVQRASAVVLIAFALRLLPLPG